MKKITLDKGILHVILYTPTRWCIDRLLALQRVETAWIRAGRTKPVSIRVTRPANILPFKSRSKH